MKVQLVPQFTGMSAKAAAYYGHAPSAAELESFYRLLTMPSAERDRLLDELTPQVTVTDHFAIPVV